MVDSATVIDVATARADELYTGRAAIDRVRDSVELLRALEEPNDYEVQWRLSRAHFFLGQETGEVEEKRAQHRWGETAGRRAIHAEPDRVEGQFWSGVNLALQAPLVTPWRSAALALHAKRNLARAIAIDPAYHGAGPHRVMGRLLHLMPQLLGGGRERARKHFERAVTLDPSNTVTRIYFAELLRDLGDAAGARVQLRAVIDTEPNPRWGFEIARDQAIARALL
jgi:hypothetical protein